MRRFVTIPVVMVAVVLGAAVPALKAGAQLVGATDQIVDGTNQLVTTDTLVTTDQLVTLTTDVTGLLIDGACYLSRGARATADHTACAIACAQKGGRLALLTPGGDVYRVIGVLTQDNNAKLIALINKAVVLTGTVGTKVSDPVTVTVTTLDTRRSAGTDQGVVAKTIFRKADFREGDIPLASELTIDAISARLPTPPGK